MTLKTRSPKAGPIEKPRLMAILLREKALVKFSGLAYLVIATEFAGRKVSLIILCSRIIRAIPSTEVKIGISSKIVVH